MRIDIKRHHKLPNLHGIYHDQYRPDTKKNIHCYYACKPGEEHVHAPPTEKWHDSIPSIPELEKECQAVARSTRMQRELPISWHVPGLGGSFCDILLVGAYVCEHASLFFQVYNHECFIC
jgi:hypothetical protein